jgi:simple sugar transport system ATP-binding protein
MTTQQERRTATPLVEVQGISKYFGRVIALQDISMRVGAGEVMCLLGDNGAGKSTLIKTLSGVHQHDEGKMLVDGEEVRFTSPRDALDRGIATVFQDLAMIPLMGISRNFFLGREPTKGVGPFKRYDAAFADRVTREQMQKMGIDIRDPSQPVGTLSGGERQSVAIARAVYFGAKVLILDEPTSALGVKQAAVVLRYIAQTRDQGLGVIFITHNVHHAYPVGDRFTILKRGRSYGTFEKNEVTREEVASMMAGGEEMENLSSELAEFEREDAEQAKRESRTPEAANSHTLAESFREESGDLHQEEDRDPNRRP